MKKFWCGLTLLFLCILSVPALSVKADAANKGTESEQGYTGWKTKKGEKYYYLDGVMQKKWQVILGKKYYFNKKGMMLTGWQKINTKWYQFSKKGLQVYMHILFRTYLQDMNTTLLTHMDLCMISRWTRSAC